MPLETLYPPPEEPAEEQDLVQCEHCGEAVAEDSRTHTREGVWVCEDCVAEVFYTCDRCDNVTRWRLRETVGGREVCDDCVQHYYNTCYRCDYLTTSSRHTQYGDTLCRGCASDHYHVCDSCSVYLQDYDEGDYCDNCAPDEDEDSDCGGLINDYMFKPYPFFHGDGPVYLGLELEVNAPRGDLHNAAYTATDRLGSVVYLKQDGSIDYGFEIVTHPMSHAWARESFPWQALEELRRLGCESRDDCGMHVHVSRESFASPAHVYRWFKLLYRNADHVTVVARRESSQWASWGGPRQHRRHKDYAKAYKEPETVYGERYSAININNSQTFEVRVFASSLDPIEVRAALDLVAASVEYTRHLSVGEIATGGGWTWANFTAWVAERPEYSALATVVGAQPFLEDLACAC